MPQHLSYLEWCLSRRVQCCLQCRSMHAKMSHISLQDLELRAKRTAGAFQERLMDIPLAMPQMCTALHLLDAGEHNP